MSERETKHGFILGPDLRAEHQELLRILRLPADERQEALRRRAAESQRRAAEYADREIAAILAG